MLRIIMIVMLCSVTACAGDMSVVKEADETERYYSVYEELMAKCPEDQKRACHDAYEKHFSR